MKLVFALGNPGSDYAGTRHNIGFIAVDTFAREHKVTFAEKTKFHAYIAELSIDGEKVLLVKPTTFYNEVGVSARALIDFYKVNSAEDLLVIHDDLSLPFGTIRVRKKGSDAGNNGVKSLNAHLNPDYARLRVGVGVENRTNDDASFVLSRFTSEESRTLKTKLIPKAHELTNDFLSNRLAETSHRLSGTS